MLNAKHSAAGYSIGLVLGTGFILLANVLLAPYGTAFDDVIGLMLFLALGGCAFRWWRLYRQVGDRRRRTDNRMQADNAPATRSDYLARAAHCERFAGAAATEENRKTFLGLAAHWRLLADKEDKPSPP